MKNQNLHINNKLKYSEKNSAKTTFMKYIIIIILIDISLELFLEQKVF